MSLHRVRQGFVKARTAQANQIRSLLSEFGEIMPQGIAHIAKRLPEITEKQDLPGTFRDLLQRLYDHLKELDKQVDELDAKIQQWHKASDTSKKLAEIPGIGPITATALVASIGDAKSFKNGRKLAAWLGLVPRQHSSGGKSVLLAISKRGDTYVAYPLSSQHLEEMMQERGVSVDHSSINRWAIRFRPLVEKMAHKHKRPVGHSWRMDETYIKVKGVWKYLYRAVDKEGNTIDFLLTAKRDMVAAKRLFDKVVRANGDHPPPPNFLPCK